MKVLIEYDSSSGSPYYEVFLGEKYVGRLEDISWRDAGVQLHFYGQFRLEEQIAILQDVVQQIKEKPLSRENYPSTDLPNA